MVEVRDFHSGRSRLVAEPDWTRDVSLSSNIHLDTVRRTYRMRRNDITFCVEQLRIDAASASLGIRVRLKISSDGSVADVSAVNACASCGQLADCAIRAVTAWRFGPTSDGHPATVSLPVVY